MVDTKEEIIKKYRLNVSGLFKRIRIGLNEALREGYNIVPEALVVKAEEIVLGMDEGQNMMKSVKFLGKKEATDMLLSKNVKFFEEHWKDFLAPETSSALVSAGDVVFKTRRPDGSLPYSSETIDKIFDFIVAIIKVALKYFLCISEVTNMKMQGDKVLYTTKGKYSDYCSDENLSDLIYQYKVVGIPKP